MKALLFTAAALFAATSASAQTSVELPLSGTLAKSCSISAYLNGPFDALNMTSTATQGSESISPICNYGGTVTVGLSSANLGSLKSGANAVPYTVSISGGLLTDASLSSPQSITNWPMVANAVQTRSISVKLTNAATIAGTYTDTITASVTPN